MSEVVDVKREATGPSYKYGRWPRKRHIRHLTLADIRALLVNVDELGIPDDRIVLALCAPGDRSRHASQGVYLLETAEKPRLRW
jgi:hypothetical protein